MKHCKYTLFGVILFCLLLAGCKKTSGITRYSTQYLDLFDTLTVIDGYASSQEEFSKETEKLYEELKTYHQLYDIYNDYENINNIKTINDNAGIAPVKVDKKIIDLLLLGKEIYEETNGKVNIAFGSVLSIWHDYRTEELNDSENAKLPPMEELKIANKHVDISKVIIDEAASTVYLEDKEMSLDVGSVGKGYATKMLTDYANREGMNHLLISVGGNISAIGTKEDGSNWVLGIQNPDTDSETAYVQKVNAKDQSLVTSGNYQRYYMVDGKMYHHIIDPNTLMPSAYFASVSILNKDSGIADALSTAVFNMPFEEGLQLIESINDTEAMWIYEDGTFAYSNGFKEAIAQ